MIRLLAVLPLALVVAACDPRLVHNSNLTPREVQTLAGTWQGDAKMSFGEESCPRVYLWTIKVAKGEAEGTMVDEKTPNAQPTVFRTFVDYDGTLNAQARPSGRDTNFRGAFNRDNFTGEAKSERCAYLIRLRRTSNS